MPKEKQLRRPYRKARPSPSGSVHGSRPLNAVDHGHVSCSVPFYPGNRYQGLLSHENHENKRYYLARHPTQPAVFTQASQRTRLTRALDPDADVQSYGGLRAVSHAIYDFCLATHNHGVTTAQRQASLTEPLRPLQEFVDWEPTIATARGGASDSRNHARATAAPKDPSPVSPSPSPQTYNACGLSGASSPNIFVPIPGFVPDFTQQRPVVAASPKRVAVEVPTYVKVPQAAVPSTMTPLAVECRNEQHSTTSIDEKPWYILSDGCVFRDATQAEAAIAQSPGIRWLSVDSLQRAGDWMLREGSPKAFYIMSDRSGVVNPIAAEQYLLKNPHVRLRIVASLVEGDRWVQSLGAVGA
ncbi:hypothetical protein B0H16DRAFT_1741903 [Mycena metata]|uniref:Uncharacterized protein n=1 Tax=Mycena metata TaxID=1033252 RepID=A0AAD7HA37_9AGAR|nr:hypothetical protein B0H16DRAFT_1741903 [Mycena metata]